MVMGKAMADGTLRALALGVAVSVLSLAAAPASAATNVERVVSERGIEAWLINEPSIPFMSLSLQFKGGAALDPEGKEGLAYMTSGLIDEGAGDLDSQAFRTELEDLAIRLSFDAGRDTVSGELRTLTEHRERAFELLRLALTEPRFDEEPVARVRSQILADLRRRSEDPNYIASLTWFETAFPDHPYGRPTRGTPESIEAIEVEDLRAFVEQRFARDNLFIGVAGDVTPEELKPLLDLAFGDLPERSAPIEIAATTPVADGTVVVRRAIPQSQILFGQEGFERHDPDFYAGHVVNHILGGGGFTSRLTAEVREKRGLAYSVYSYLLPTDFAPLWLGGAGTDNVRVAETVSLVREQVAVMAEGQIGEEELADAKTYLTGSFPLRLTSNDQIAGMLASMQAQDLGIDFLERRNEYIEAVEMEDVRRAAARLYDPDNLLVVVVGDPEGLEG
jgi:zinc protease